MPDTIPHPPSGAVIAVWFRPRQPRARWRKLAVCRDRAEALKVVDRQPSGDYALLPVRNPELAGQEPDRQICRSGQPGLFDPD